MNQTNIEIAILNMERLNSLIDAYYNADEEQARDDISVSIFELFRCNYDKLKAAFYSK